MVDSALDHGVVGGSLRARQRRRRPWRCLGCAAFGERADAIPVASVNLNSTQVDWRQLRRWASAKRTCRPDLVRFRDPTLWDRYSSYITVPPSSFSPSSR